MEINLEEIEYCKVGVVYKADPDTVKSTKEKVLEQMTKTYQVKGFRKGHATKDAIRFTLYKEVDYNLTQALVNQAYTDTIAEKSLKPFGRPNFSDVNLAGNNFDCKFVLHTIPSFELKEYKGFDIPKYASPKTADEFTQQILQEMRVEKGETVPYTENDVVAMNDSVIINYQSFLEEQPIEDLTATGTLVQVGKISIPGFDDNILGMKLDEEREFLLRTPATFKTDYADKVLNFKVKLVMGSKIVPAALDNAFAEKVGFKTLEELMQKVQMMGSERIQEWEAAYLHDQVEKRLLENHSIKIPQWIVVPEAKVQGQAGGKKWEELTDAEKEQMLVNAERSVKFSLILSKIQEEVPDVQLTDEELMKLATLNLQKFAGNEVDKVMEDLYTRGQLAPFLNRIREEYVLNFIIKNCNIIE